MYEIILSYLLNHAEIYDKKNEENLKDRIEILSRAIDYGTESRRVLGWGKTHKLEMIALTLTVGEIESYWAKYIHENRCLEGPWKCDINPKTGLPRAKSNFQLWPSACGQWSQIKGADLESTKTAANCSAKLLSIGVNRCKTIKGAFNVYAGKSCNTEWKGLKKRITKYNKILTILTQKLSVHKQ